jgi:signal transduction histidine kinase
MLDEFLISNRETLIDRCKVKVALRPAPKASKLELEYGIPLFLDQLIKTLQMERASNQVGSRKVSGTSGGGNPIFSEIGESATRHGSDLLKGGFTIDQVVHDYGDLCQAITDLASETDTAIHVNEFRIFNRCLDNAIADAVTEFSYQRDFTQGYESDTRLGNLAHELRNLLNSATLAFTAIKSGTVGAAGATGAIVDRSLSGISRLIDRSLAEVRMGVGLPPRYERIALTDIISEIKITGTLEAKDKECSFSVGPIAEKLVVEADRDMLLSAIGNLLQNAFKFTKPHTEVSLNAYAYGDHILIDVEDNCGGLQPGCAESMFQPFVQHNSDKSGVGLGLSISRAAIEANKGVLSVRDVPGHGCIFTIALPRR